MVLVVPVFAGALVLTLGVVLHFIETCWRGQGRSQGVADAAQLLVYWGLMLAFLDLRFGWFTVGGMSLCLLNRLWRERSPNAVLTGIAHQAESTFTLLLNTVSFARVGAFALAHAALESAVVLMAGGVTNKIIAILIFVLGNVVVIVLESIVVSIQTTRLVLFEFFVRFFEGQGRQFRPAARSPAARQTLPRVKPAKSSRHTDQERSRQ
jgi:V/A-type H+-transporting ATPase subunit I